MTKTNAARQRDHRLKLKPYIDLARSCKHIDQRLDSCHDAILDLMEILTTIDSDLSALKCSRLFKPVLDCDSEYSKDLLRKENLL